MNTTKTPLSGPWAPTRHHHSESALPARRYKQNWCRRLLLLLSLTCFSCGPLASAQAAGTPTYQQLFSFGEASTNLGGGWGVVQGADGALYGTSSAGGSANFGTVFKLHPDGSGF